ncbi:hypothetical protein P3T37_007384 [Kitasatospora sp. MAA4]|uniref:hypothetical protein n=1 Tax=Kitasatospora sp. MAA4 TaxID=3035093 RepID=UPI002475F871|nr:hypothetical protein [Kitasatospora sp. MAA4]MDH6137946.1 hypothetical protein [Kitasatospora sp. MAA4]
MITTETTPQPGTPVGRDWREELESTRLARFAVARLRRALAAGSQGFHKTPC